MEIQILILAVGFLTLLLLNVPVAFFAIGICTLNLMLSMSGVDPFFVAMLIALLVTTYWPAITMWLPQLLDLV